MNKNDVLITYSQGFYDQLNNISIKEYTDPIFNKAYKLGKKHAILGDDNTDFDYISKEEILKLIYK